MAGAIAAGGVPAAPVPRTAAADWPVYRHDVALTGVSPAKGRIREPEVVWEHYLGAPAVPLATDRAAPPSDVADLDGDGTLERFSLRDRTVEVTDLQGRRLWSHQVTGHPLGGNVRVSRLFPGSKGLQLLSFSSAMDTGNGQGYCFTFEEGVRSGKLAWTTGPLTGQHAPTLLVDDVDGDGAPEVVTAPHYRVQIFNGQTGALKAEVPWDVGRNYGILVSRPRKDRPQKDLFIVCDFVLHVDCIRFQDGKWRHAWGHKYVDPNQPAPRGREKYLRTGPNPVADVDGDARDEVVYMLVEADAGDRWRLRVRDAETGAVKADVPGAWLWSVTDLDGDGAAELVYTPTDEKRPPTWCDLHVGRLRGGKLVDAAVLPRVRPLLMNTTLPLSAHTIADEGQQDLLRTDVDRDGRPELFYAVPSLKGRFEDAVEAAALTGQRGKEALRRKWRLARPGHRLNVVHAGPEGSGPPRVRVRDLTTNRLLTLVVCHS